MWSYYFSKLACRDNYSDLKWGGGGGISRIDNTFTRVYAYCHVTVVYLLAFYTYEQGSLSKHSRALQYLSGNPV